MDSINSSSATIEDESIGSNSISTIGTVASRKSRGRNYSPFENSCIAMAFAKASENSTNGANMRSEDFQEKMYTYYSGLIHEQEHRDKFRQECMSSSIGPMLYESRSASAIYSHFRDNISPRVSKFIGVEKTITIQSGSNAEDEYQQCKEAFSKRYPKLGNFDNYRLCKEYLANSPKFKVFQKEDMKDDPKRRSRPIGTKAAKQQAKDVQSITAALINAGFPPVVNGKNLGYVDIL
jgi:hypothetical protein